MRAVRRALLLALAFVATPAQAAELDPSTARMTVGGRVVASVAVRAPSGWHAATRAESVQRDGSVVRARLATTDAARSIDVELAPDGEGAERLVVRSDGATAVRAAFAASGDE